MLQALLKGKLVSFYRYTEQALISDSTSLSLCVAQ